MITEPIISINSLVKNFRAGKSGLWSSGEQIVHALDNVSFDLAKGEMLALVGESGCGKSTLSLSLMLLERPTSGTISFEGEDVTQSKGKSLKSLRRHIQMVFQDPYESLNPLMTIGEIVAEPLIVHNLAKNPGEQAQRVKFALESAGLRPPEIFLNRLPHELSGGQRQRVVIASALVLEPTVLLADEPVSMLDVSIRAEILNLLADLRKEKGISIIFITHDLATAANICDRIAVMYLGRIVEIGPTLDVLKHPSHPYTKALMSVIPIPNPRHRKKRIILQGAPPDAVEIPSGCRFHPRCPSVFDRCPLEDPMLRTIHGTHQVACWLPAIDHEKGVKEGLK
jgi:oligopeptide/dipeptide ABC transporter ATP-binding protein